MKIDRRFVFPLDGLKDYLRVNWDNSTVQYEILTALTVSKVFKDERPGEYFIYFPLLSSHEKRFPIDKEVFYIEDFFKLFHDGNAPEDIFLLREEAGHYGVIPLQIKKYGVGKWASGSAKELIDFLKEKSHFTPSDMCLVIPLENIEISKDTKVYLEETGKWLRENDFPFKSVIAIHPFVNGEMLFWQLKPSKDIPEVKKFSKEDITN